MTVATDAELKAGGFILPTNDDMIRNGDDAISQNARATAEWVDQHAVQQRNLIADGTDLNMVTRDTGRGFYYIPSASSWQTLGNRPPDTYAGTAILLVHSGPPGYSYTSQEIVVMGSRPARLSRVMISTTEWSPWRSVDSARGGLLPEGTDMNDLTGSDWVGEYYVPTTSLAQSLINYIDPAKPALVKIMSGPHGYRYTMQMVYVWGTAPDVLWRIMSSATEWTPWTRLGGSSGGGEGDPLEPSAVGMRNADLLSELVQRKGGPIGLDGRAGFALRLDHGSVAFRDTLGPLLKKYGIPATMAVYSQMDTVKPAENGVPWSEVEQWHRTHGITFGNHSDDHLDKPDAEGWYGGTIGSQAELRTLMPSVPVEQYIPHGSAGYDRYGGFNAADSHEAIVGTLAGRMALSSHGLVSGYRGGDYRPLRGRPIQGLRHWSMEEASVESFKSMVDGAITYKAGLAVMFHPEFIGLAGKMTWAQVEECLAYVAQKRDEGLVVPLTLDGLACADYYSPHRDDLILDPMMQDASSWYGSGFTETPGAFTSSTTGAYTHALIGMSRQKHLHGGSRVAQWHVSTSGGATLTSHVEPQDATPAWTSQRTVTLEPGESTIVYHPFGIPLDMTAPGLRVRLYLDAGDVTISEAHAYSA